MTDKSDKSILMNFTEVTFLYRHGISGSSSFSPDILCDKNCSASAYVRVGYLPVKDILIYFKIGIGLNQYIFDKFYIVVENNISIDRFDDQDITANSLFEEFPKSSQYSAPTGRTYTCSMNLGVGIERCIQKNWFIRVEYECNFGFSNRLKLFSDAKVDYNNLSFEYALRYQDMGNEISVGFGKRF
jgi:opacity protein-like surface antigen